ncbi:class I SAM-dependent methyltransferase [Streptomyces sp. NPDC001797]|uniref:class I SAM-dependent methyltransferase n=1 Tax=Streptomyces sp. NPDC001797 TaxID=3364610 RepID=UPI0036A6DAEC
MIQRLAQRSEQAMARNFWREEVIASHIQPYMPTTGEILDLGAGSCKLAHHLTERHHHKVTALDIVDHNVTSLPLRLYPGGRLPFPADHFDAVLLIFVLHHAIHPEDLLSEAVRVAKSKIIIVEDAPAGPIQRRAWHAWDYMLNHGTHADVHLAQEPPDLDGWSRYLNDLGLPPAHVHPFRTAFPVAAMFRHALFVVDVP